MAHYDTAAFAQQSQHRTVAREHLGFELWDALGGGGLEEGVEQRPSETAAPRLGHHDPELTVAVWERRIPRFAHEPPTCGVGNLGDEARLTIVR